MISTGAAPIARSFQRSIAFHDTVKDAVATDEKVLKNPGQIYEHPFVGNRALGRYGEARSMIEPGNASGAVAHPGVNRSWIAKAG
jgi:hypothetical protein